MNNENCYLVFIIDSKREPDTRPRWNINSFILRANKKNYSHFKSVNLSSNICPKIEIVRAQIELDPDSSVPWKGLKEGAKQDWKRFVCKSTMIPFSPARNRVDYLEKQTRVVRWKRGVKRDAFSTRQGNICRSEFTRAPPSSPSLPPLVSNQPTVNSI